MIAGLVLLLGLGPELDSVQGWLEQNPEYLVENVNLVVIVMTILILPVIAASLYLAWLGFIIIKHQRFPPQDLTLIRDTRIYEGQSALIRGRIVLALSMVVFVAAASIPVLIWYILEELAARMTG